MPARKAAPGPIKIIQFAADAKKTLGNYGFKMKYTIEGFSQEVALELKLDIKDLVFLRWLVDFYSASVMEKHDIDGHDYFWVSYQYVIKQIPMLGITSSDALGRRLKGLSAVLELKMKPTSSGNKICFRFKEASMIRLLSSTPPDPKVGWMSTQKSGGCRPKSRVESYSSINDSSINDKREPALEKENKAGKFTPPTIDQVRAYCLERKNQIDPEAFLNFYESKGWMVGNNKMKDWRASVRTWEGRNKDQGRLAGGNGKVVNWKRVIAERLGKIATDGMIKALMREMPDKFRWMVDEFLKQRYPQSDGTAFLRIESELIREAKENESPRT